MEALDEMDIPNFPICGLAKKEELIYLPGLSEPIRLERRNLGLRLLQYVRDEAHRFGNSYNAQLRGKRVQHSTLRNIKGVGPAKERALLRHFGSIKKMKSAPIEELCHVPGVTEELAQRILDS